MPTAYLSLVLHAHLPYVRHAEHDDFLEERWLFEAITECYLPLLRVFERLVRDRVPFRLALALSPTLLEMLDDPLLRGRYLRHLARHRALAEREVARLRADARFHPLAVAARDGLAEAEHDFGVRLRGDLPAAFAALRDAGALELLTTAATHAYLPLHRVAPSTIRAQVRLGTQRLRGLGGAAGPPGFWLPECGYFPGLERELSAAGVRWFVVDTHGLLHADTRPHCGTFAPVACPNGVAAFARDPDCSRRVWSATEGYPGDPEYREFHRDLGFERTPEELGACAGPGGARVATGLKYWRVTGRTEEKQPYRPDRAAARVEAHAADFVARCAERAAAAAPAMDRPPLLVAPFDAELFGHWWHEGPAWIERVLRLAAESGALECLTPTDYLHRHPLLQRATPAESSWGRDGAHAPWLNAATEAFWPPLHDAAERLAQLARRFPPGRGAPEERAVRQAARHLLLAQASDWPFMIRNGSAAAFAEKMLRDQLARFGYLDTALRRGAVDPERLCALEQLDPVFAELDYGVFA